MFEIGTSLREARLRRGLDLSEAELATKIRVKYLRALEEERFELLPGETYVKGFLRTYAEYLGLDGQLYVDEFNSRYVTGEDDVPLRTRHAPLPRAHRRFATSAVALTLGAIVVVTALVFVAWRFGDPDGDDTLIPNLPSPPAASQARKPTRPKPPPPASQRGPAPPATARLVVTASRGDSWIEVRNESASGRQLFQGTLELGRSQQFAARRLWVNIGRPQSLTLRLNGKVQRLEGDDSRIVTITPRGLSPASALG